MSGGMIMVSAQIFGIIFILIVSSCQDLYGISAFFTCWGIIACVTISAFAIPFLKM
jgi:hypothetical protein